ncbi:MAG: hypothetical protein SWO11_20025 [Thermodesulfobacteriota bacterium]|nr:hypothetical protein [Thermodesulfobacteriota bacterium]
MSAQISDIQLELINWMMFYYKKPVPDEFPGWLKKTSAEGIFKEEQSQFPFLGFAAAVFATNTDKIHQWMETIDALPEDDRKTTLIALFIFPRKIGHGVKPPF